MSQEELKEKVNDLRMDFSEKVLKLFRDSESKFTKQESISICEFLGVPYRIIRENDNYNVVHADTVMGRLNLEFENNILVDILVE